MSAFSPTSWFSKKDKGPEDGSIEQAMMNSEGGAPKAPEEGYPQPFLPSISAIPQSRISVLKRRKAVKKSMAITLTTLAVVGISVMGLVVTLIASKAAESDAKDTENQARAEVETLLPVRDLYEGFEERQGAVANALSADIDFYELINGVQEAIQDEIPRDALMEDESGTLYVKENWSHIRLTSYNINMTPCATDQPFDPDASLGCIQGTAVSSSYAEAGDAIKLLNDTDNGLFGGYITSANELQPIGEGDSAVGETTWSFSINFGAGALSGKYAEESDAILNAGDPIIGPTPSPSAPAEPTTAPSATEGEN